MANLVHVVSRNVVRSLSMATATGVTKNRLASEKSPYLLQHATNPVDWYPWGEEAFSKALAEKKPIFLSVGYSTCHWCHVMERESFENHAVAEILNKHFVSIKVDREERPDVDRVYMTFVQATQGGGGWPMSVFLSPDLKPFVGGTYFPPNDSHGRPGFITLLKMIREQWASDSQAITQRMEKVLQMLKDAVAIEPKELRLPGSSCIQKAAELFDKRFDKQFGGFGSHPKFPQPIILDFLLRVFNKYSNSQMGESAFDMTTNTLRAMANGGIHDHIGQGFHRYSTDREWHVPHFEKMLYDQAQLACVYLDAYQITGEKLFNDVACDILLYVSRDLTDKDGGFYSAEDADSFPLGKTSADGHKKEGAFCVWTCKEVNELLDRPAAVNSHTKMADVFIAYYGMKPDGNVDKRKDPHGELSGQNVLIVTKTIQQLTEQFKLSEEQILKCLNDAKKILYEKRQQRPKPHRDDKIVTSWNGLMISAFARAARVLGDKAYLKIAEKCAKFIKQNMYKNELLLRSAYRDETGEMFVGDIEGFTDDYSSMVCALLDLYESSHNADWLEWAVSLQKKQDQLFLDTNPSSGGGYFSSSGSDKRILLQMKEDQDGSEPSPNSLSAMNLLRLSTIFHSPEYQTAAENIFKNFNEHLNEHPVALTGMVSAYLYFTSKPKQIVVIGDPCQDETLKLIQVIDAHYIPNKVVIFHNPSDPSPILTRLIPVLANMKLVNNKSTVQVCEDYRCQAPTNNPQVLKNLLVPKRTI